MSNQPNEMFSALSATHGHDEPRKKAVKHKTNIRVAALNITSFMDLTFNLLLFFVLTANFASAEGVLLATLPKGSGSGGAAITSPDEDPTKTTLPPVRIFLQAVPNQPAFIRIEGVPTSPGQDYELFYQTLKQWRRDPSNPNGAYDPDQPINIQPDKNCTWNDVVNAFNAAVRARYTSVGLLPAS
jgi:biopolymer transport protein ExbD